MISNEGCPDPVSVDKLGVLRNRFTRPFDVFAAAPYGVAGRLIALWVTNASFGFVAFLGIAGLIGVIVSHAIVPLNFIEEMHAEFGR